MFLEKGVSQRMVDAVANSNQTAVIGALKSASQQTGVGFDFLYKMARRESALDPSAKASTSTAAGLFQFIEQTWLGAVKNYGEEHGLGEFANEIVRGNNGQLTIENATRREEVLNLRFDPEKASALAAELTNENKNGLERRLGRAVGAVELYAAHFLGPSGAAKLLSADPNAKAADLLPSAAAANKPVFFDGNTAKSVASVISNIEKSMNAAVKSAGPAIDQLTRAAAIDVPVPKTELRVASIRTPLAERSAPIEALNTEILNGETSNIETSIARAPRFLETGFFANGSIDIGNSFSPLALILLQALDPSDLLGDRSER